MSMFVVSCKRMCFAFQWTQHFLLMIRFESWMENNFDFNFLLCSRRHKSVGSSIGDTSAKCSANITCLSDSQFIIYSTIMSCCFHRRSAWRYIPISHQDIWCSSNYLLTLTWKVLTPNSKSHLIHDYFWYICEPNWLIQYQFVFGTWCSSECLYCHYIAFLSSFFSWRFILLSHTICTCVRHGTHSINHFPFDVFIWMRVTHDTLRTTLSESQM